MGYVKPALAPLDYGIVIGYLVFAILIGVVFSKKASKSAEDFFLGGRSLPWWMIGISMVATSYASDTPLAITELVRKYGVQRMWWQWSGCIGLIFGIFIFAQLWRRANIITDAQYIEMRYSGKSAAFLRGFKAFHAGIVSNFVTMAWVTLAMTSIITTLTDFDKWSVIVTCASVAVIYSVLSGFYGVVVTDFVQFFIALFGMGYLAIVAYIKVGGPATIIQKISATPGYGPEKLTIFPDFSQGLTLDLFSMIVLLAVLSWSDQGGYNMQRMSSCRNEKDAVRATLFYAIFNTIRVWLWVPVALVSIVLFPDLSGHPNHDTGAYPMVINEYLGVGMKGLLIASFLAAFMSTIDTHLNWGASYIMTDVYRRFIRPDASEKHYMVVTRVVIVLLMIGAASLVPFLTSVSAAWEFLALMGCGTAIVGFIRWFWWRINAFSELAVLVTSMALATLNLILCLTTPDLTFLPALQLCTDPATGAVYTIKTTPFVIKLVLILPVSLTISFAVTFLTRPVSKEKLEKFYRLIRPGGFWGCLSPEVRSLPSVLTPMTVFYFFSGMALALGLSIGIGYLLLAQAGKAAIAFCIAGAGCFGVFKFMNTVEVEKT